MTHTTGTPLDQTLAAYIECALWSTPDTSAPEGRDDMLDAHYGVGDLAPETLATMRADVGSFLAENQGAIFDAGDDYARVGHDLWLTRNGHGAGFWDGDWPEPAASTLTAASKAMGPVDLYVGDDGKIYS